MEKYLLEKQWSRLEVYALVAGLIFMAETEYWWAVLVPVGLVIVAAGFSNRYQNSL
jgi:hypothetical protein